MLNYIYYLLGYTDEKEETWCPTQRAYKYDVLKEIKKNNFTLKKKFNNKFHKKLIFKKKINIL